MRKLTESAIQSRPKATNSRICQGGAFDQQGRLAGMLRIVDDRHALADLVILDEGDRVVAVVVEIVADQPDPLAAQHAVPDPVGISDPRIMGGGAAAVAVAAGAVLDVDRKDRPLRGRPAAPFGRP
jgi:hypothetical protein